MNQHFVFEAKQKNFFFALMAIGVLCLGITFFTDDALHTRFWTNFLHNTVFFTGIAFIALFFYCANALAYAGWHSVFKRVWEAMFMFLGVGIILMAIIMLGVWGHFHHLYHWADSAEVAKDEVLRGKSSFLNPIWYTLATLGFGGAWYFFANKMRSISLKEDDHGGTDYAFYKQQKYWGAMFLPIAGFTSAAAIWQWVMSIDAHWYSTMFAWYATSSWFVSMCSLTILLLIYLKSKGYYDGVTKDHFHDLGKYLFGFSIFWTYLWFSQYMLIWYANNGEETIYFKERMGKYSILFYANLVINFVAPLLILIRNDNKRKFGVIGFMAGLIFFGHWIDFFQMIKPGALITAKEHLEKHAAHGTDAAHKAAEHATAHGGHGVEAVSTFITGFTIPGLLEIGTMLGFLGLFLYLTFNQLTKASLVPKRDPYLAESLHHHVW